MVRWLRHPGIIAGILLLTGGAYWFLRPRAVKPIGVGYVGEQTVTVWNTLAQVRQPIADLHYGDRLELLNQEGNAAQVRTSSGVTGWLLDSRQMMDATLWQRSADLLARARGLPVQALGHTNAISNVHIDPGRNTPRVFQFSRGTPIAVLSRMVVADTSGSGTDNAPSDDASSKSKSEDWLLVVRVPGAAPSAATAGIAANSALAQPPQESTQAPPSTASSVGGGPDSQAADASGGSSTTPIAGWLLARFIDPDLPDTVKDHASSANMRPVAWFELNRVPDGSGGEASQYLVAGTRGGEGQACDFTMLQVYTWGAARMRYETAYVESDLCGKLPILVSRSARGPQFRFENAGNGQGEFSYVMQDTSVRRIREAPAAPPKQRRTPS